MLKDLKIKNFKCFKDFEIKNLKQVNLITGGNNAGKSTLIEAITLLFNPNIAYFINGLSFYTEFNEIACFSFFNKMNSNELIEISTSENKQNLKINLEEEPIEENEDKSSQLEFFRESKDNLRFIFDYTYVNEHKRTRERVIISKKIPYRNRRMSNFTNLTKKISHSQMIHLSDYAKLYENLQDNKQEAEIINIINKTMPNEHIKEITIGTDNTLKIDIGYDKLIPFYALGDGITKLFKLLICIYNSQNGIVVIDEVENGFHHSVLVSLWKVIFTAAKEFNVQIFATTHSWECIAAYMEAFEELGLEDDFDNYYRLEKDKNEEISYVEYFSNELRIALENNFETR